jgi:hypothetical protein
MRWNAAVLPFMSSEPQDEIFAVEPIKQHREKGLQIEIPDQGVLATQIHNGLIELRFARFRAETRGTESHDFELRQRSISSICSLNLPTQTSVT